MTRAEKLMLIADTLHAVAGSWSANDVVALARLMGMPVRRSEALDALRDGPPNRRFGGAKLVPTDCAQRFFTRGGRAENAVNKGPEPVVARSNERHRKRRTSSQPINKGPELVRGHLSTASGTSLDGKNCRSAGDAVSPLHPPKIISSIDPISSETTSRTNSFAIGKIPRAHEKNTKNGPEPPWLNALREATRSLELRTLRALSPAERNIVARYHAYRFGNCIRNLRGNQLGATRVAAGLCGLAIDSRYCELTVRQYVNLGDVVLAERGGVPFLSAWYVVGAAEVEREHHALGPMWVRASREVVALQLALEIAAL